MYVIGKLTTGDSVIDGCDLSILRKTAQYMCYSMYSHIPHPEERRLWEGGGRYYSTAARLSPSGYVRAKEWLGKSILPLFFCALGSLFCDVQLRNDGWSRIVS